MLRLARRTITSTLGTLAIAVLVAMVASQSVAAVEWVVAWPSDADRWWSIVVVAGAVLSIAIVHRARTTGQTVGAFRRALDDPPGDLRPVPALVVAGATGVGLGTPLGLDGPALHLGGALGAVAARILRRGERTWTIAAGVAALSMAIDAPVAAALFAVEIGPRRWPRRRDVMPLAVGAIAGWAVRRAIGDRGGVVGGADLGLRTIAMAALVVGVVCGLAGGWFAGLLDRVRSLRWGFGRRVVVAAVTLGVAVPVGWAATGHAIFVGSGDRILDWARSSSGLPTTAGLAAATAVLIALVAADVVGGLIVPLLSVGGLIGLLLVQTFLPGTPVSFAVVASGCALLAVVHRTPATAVALGVAAFGWSMASLVTAGAVLLAIAASGQPPRQSSRRARGQHVRS